MSERAAPMFCPYCGEERLRPWGDGPDAGHGDWSCEDCLRVFRLRYTGSTGRPGSAGATPAGADADRP